MREYIDIQGTITSYIYSYGHTCVKGKTSFIEKKSVSKERRSRKNN